MSTDSSLKTIREIELLMRVRIIRPFTRELSFFYETQVRPQITRPDYTRLYKKNIYTYYVYNMCIYMVLLYFILRSYYTRIYNIEIYMYTYDTTGQDLNFRSFHCDTRDNEMLVFVEVMRMRDRLRKVTIENTVDRYA